MKFLLFVIVSGLFLFPMNACCSLMDETGITNQSAEVQKENRGTKEIYVQIDEDMVQYLKSYYQDFGAKEIKERQGVKGIIQDQDIFFKDLGDFQSVPFFITKNNQVINLLENELLNNYVYEPIRDLWLEKDDDNEQERYLKRVFLSNIEEISLICYVRSYQSDGEYFIIDWTKPIKFKFRTKWHGEFLIVHITPGKGHESINHIE